jgi:hypothetical protein
MSGSDASSHEMPGFPSPSWPSREPETPLLDMILDGQPLPNDAPYGVHALAARLAELADPAEPGALPGEAAALAAFSRAHSPGSAAPARRPAPRRRDHLLTAGRARLAAVVAAVAVALGGTAAAYAGDLPRPVQNFAHRLIGAPASRSAPSRAGQQPAGHQGHQPGAGTRTGTPAGHGHRAAQHRKSRGLARRKHGPGSHQLRPAKPGSSPGHRGSRGGPAG